MSLNFIESGVSSVQKLRGDSYFLVYDRDLEDVDVCRTVWAVVASRALSLSE